MKQELEPNQYQCAQCGGIFEKGWTDEEAKSEAEQKFPSIKPDEMEMVCDPCYKELIQVNEN